MSKYHQIDACGIVLVVARHKEIGEMYLIVVKHLLIVVNVADDCVNLDANDARLVAHAYAMLYALKQQQDEEDEQSGSACTHIHDHDNSHA